MYIYTVYIYIYIPHTLSNDKHTQYIYIIHILCVFIIG